MKITYTPETIEECIGVALREYRETEGLTQAALCSRFNLTQSTASRIEAGEAELPATVLILLPSLFDRARVLLAQNNLLPDPRTEHRREEEV